MTGEAQRVIQVMGRIVAPLPNALFRVSLDDGREVLAHTSAELRMGSVRLMPGDRVRIALSPYDLSRGRIIDLRREQGS